MSSLLDRIEVAETIAISGHVRPDGDCVGSTTGLYRYISENFPEKKVYLTLEKAPDSVQKCIDCSMIMSALELPEDIDLFVSLDCSSLDRLGDAAERFETAKERFVVDHHKTNAFFGDYNEVVPEASSCCEVLYDLLDEERISYKAAVSLYLGIVHDTGGFKYSSTSKHTMEIAGKLLDKGIDSAFIIDTSFYERSWIQNKLMARAISNAQLTEDGFVAYTVISQNDLTEFDATSADTDGIVEQLRLTEGVEIAMFIREDAENAYKVSLRAK
ncbi:MAG: bifunctional oligoribonuclease/PAP phosphatase NrnA, partial [Lachnospiraceae bacterium]|nr:bifunctional oligoribonuclease/PAP phosphatase NrnA [Lachnospiraceae bacterium]